MATKRPLNVGRVRRSVTAACCRLLAASALVGAMALPATALAATFRLDTTLTGADFDSILDGFPGLATLDGAGDLPGNALAVSLKTGVTEERALLELPLASLASAGVDAAQITSAKLFFNIDDVLTTFGPGTDFDSTAGEHIYVAVYAGDGVVDLPDFAAGTQAGSVTTGPHGSITDASVRSGGPVEFEIDVTSGVKQLVAAGATHVGLVLSTDDSPTGTSIDDRGDGGTGAPGSGGATMPFLVIVTGDATPTPVPSATPTSTPTSPPVVTPSPGPTASAGPTPSPGSATPRPSGTPTPTGVATTSPATPTPLGSATPAGTPTATPNASRTPGPTATPGATATPGPSATPGASTTPGTTPTPRATASLVPGLTPTPRPVLTASPRPTSTSGSTAPTPSPTPVDGSVLDTLRPEASGDQLVFYFDARDGFTTFLNLHNLGVAALRVRLVLCDAALAPQLEQDIDLDAGTTRTIDVASLRAAGLPAAAGAAFASAIDDDGQALVSRALTGSFTVANLATGSAWGAPAAARRAVAVDDGDVTTPALGVAIDGDLVRLQRVRPSALELAVYYDPATLEPAAIGGNQLLLLSFDDDVAGTAVAAPTIWQLDAHRADGGALAVEPITVSGVSPTHVTALLDDAAEGAAGSIHFRTEDGAHNRLIFFVQSIGTFATGYLLPSVTP